ncbi:hypothetical protein M153_16506000563, partial [Pseudoloma neurophilia]
MYAYSRKRELTSNYKAIIPADGNEESKYQKKKSDQFIAEAHERLGHSGIVR